MRNGLPRQGTAEATGLDHKPDAIEHEGEGSLDPVRSAVGRWEGETSGRRAGVGATWANSEIYIRLVDGPYSHLSGL